MKDIHKKDNGQFSCAKITYSVKYLNLSLAKDNRATSNTKAFIHSRDYITLLHLTLVHNT